MNKLILAFAIISTIGMSCSKTTTTTTTTNTPAGNPQPSFGAVDGGLIAINTVTSTTALGTTYDVALGTGVAVFGNLSAGTYVDAGTVTLNDQSLAIQTNKTYVFTPGMTNPTGIDLGSSIKWKVSGNSANGISALDFTTSKIMPKAGSLNMSSAEINTATDFTLSTTSNVINADSVYFQISGGSNGKLILKRAGGTVKSVTFTSAELKTLGTGSGSVAICPFNFETKVTGGKTYAIVNELALAKVITLK